MIPTQAAGVLAIQLGRLFAKDGCRKPEDILLHHRETVRAFVVLCRRCGFSDSTIEPYIAPMKLLEVGP